MKNWLIGIFSFRNKAVKKITRYQKQESMPEIESPKNTDRPPRARLSKYKYKITTTQSTKKNTRNATRSWACCCLRSTSTWSAWWTASRSCYWFLFDNILFVWSFWLFLRCFEWSVYFAKFFFVILNLLWTAAGSRWCSFRFRLYLIYKKEILKSNWLSNSSRAQQFIWVAK